MVRIDSLNFPHWLTTVLVVVAAWLICALVPVPQPFVDEWHSLVVRVVGHWFDLVGVLHLSRPDGFAVGAIELSVTKVLIPLSSPVLSVGLIWAYGRVRRLPWRVWLRLLITSALIGLIQPMVTVFLAGYAAQAWQWDSASWIERSSFNLCGLVLGLVLVFCSDMLEWFLVSPMIVAPQELMPITIWWNRAVSGMRRDPNLVGNDGKKIRVPNESRLVMFLHHWSVTRPWWALALGLPVVAVATMLVASYRWHPGERVLVHRYQDAVLQAYDRSQKHGIEGDELDAAIARITADVLSSRLLQLAPTNAVATSVQAGLVEGATRERLRFGYHKLYPQVRAGDDEFLRGRFDEARDDLQWCNARFKVTASGVSEICSEVSRRRTDSSLQATACGVRRRSAHALSNRLTSSHLPAGPPKPLHINTLRQTRSGPEL